MLTTTMRQIREQNNERTFVGHVFRVPLDNATGAGIYHLGITLEDGTPVGLVTSATGDVLRKWRRLNTIEELLDAMPERLISITLYPSTCPEPAVVNMLIKQYGLERKLNLATIESERIRLLAALQSAQAVA